MSTSTVPLGQRAKTEQLPRRSVQPSNASAPHFPSKKVNSTPNMPSPASSTDPVDPSVLLPKLSAHFKLLDLRQMDVAIKQSSTLLLSLRFHLSRSHPVPVSPSHSPPRSISSCSLSLSSLSSPTFSLLVSHCIAFVLPRLLTAQLTSLNSALTAYFEWKSDCSCGLVFLTPSFPIIPSN